MRTTLRRSLILAVVAVLALSAAAFAQCNAPGQYKNRISHQPAGYHQTHKAHAAHANAFAMKNAHKVRKVNAHHKHAPVFAHAKAPRPANRSVNILSIRFDAD